VTCAGGSVARASSRGGSGARADVARAIGLCRTAVEREVFAASDVWGDVLVELARADERIVVVTGDLVTTTRLARVDVAMPERILHVGGAEASVFSVAAGLSAAGLVPVVVAEAAAVARAAEIVRAAVALDGRAVTIVGLLAGVASGDRGPASHGAVDVAAMRAVPGMTVVAPSDGAEMAEALSFAVRAERPCYLRWSRSTEETVDGRPPFEVGRAQVLRAGKDVTLVATGATVIQALRAEARLGSEGVSARVVAVPTLKPFDGAAVLSAARSTRRIVTVEDGPLAGGLGSAVAEVLATRRLACALVRLGHPEPFDAAGPAEDLMHLGGFDEDGIVAAARGLMERR